jgi:hypothetical protein
MASLANPYFNKAFGTEQTLFQSLITESIQIMGKTYYYLPRELVYEDDILNEEKISRFKTAIPIEMFHEKTEGWDENSELLSKFGLSINNQITFVVSKPRWETELLSSASKMKVSTRPQEGDLIWDEVSDALLEIKFVKQTNSDFFQLGKVYQYQLTCEFFQYQDEQITTGITGIDDIVTAGDLDKNLANVQILQQNGSNILIGTDSYLLLDAGDSKMQSRDFDDTPELKEESYDIEFNVKNPFGGF